MFKDVIWAFRSLVRYPSFSIVGLITLTLGIGSATSVFSVVHGVLLKDLPYVEADRLVLVHAEQDYDGANNPIRTYFPLTSIAAWLNLDSFDGITLYSEDTAALATESASELVDVSTVSGAFFSVVQGEILSGRFLDSNDSGMSVAVISERLSYRLFGGNLDGIGRQLVLNSQPVTVVGVAKDSFQLPTKATDIWVPAGFVRGSGYTPLARLKEGASIASATDEVRIVANSLEDQAPRQLGGVRVSLAGLNDQVVRQVRPALTALFAAVILLLLLSFANVLNLGLAREISRSRETFVQRALGARGIQLVRHAAMEVAILASAGCILGLVLARIAIDALLYWSPPGLPRIDAIAIDDTAALFAMAMAALTILSVGILPSLIVAKGDSGALNSGRSIVSGSFRTRATLRGLTVFQLAISFVLLVGGALLARSFVALINTDLGVETQNVVTASLNLTHDRSLDSVETNRTGRPPPSTNWDHPPSYCRWCRR